MRPLSRRGTAADGGGSDLAPRYALSTLVGIAGADDLDAPNLAGNPPSLGQGGKRVRERKAQWKRRRLTTRLVSEES
jgi:hypothetical protein